MLLNTALLSGAVLCTECPHLRRSGGVVMCARLCCFRRSFGSRAHAGLYVMHDWRRLAHEALALCAARAHVFSRWFQIGRDSARRCDRAITWLLSLSKFCRGIGIQRVPHALQSVTCRIPGMGRLNQFRRMRSPIDCASVGGVQFSCRGHRPSRNRWNSAIWGCCVAPSLPCSQSVHV